MRNQVRRNHREPVRRPLWVWAVRVIGAAALLLFLAAALFVGHRFVRYTFFYSSSEFNPASLESVAPTYFYLDWRHPWSDSEKLREQVDAEGVLRSPRDRQVGQRVKHDPLRVIQACLAVHDLLRDSRSPEREVFLARQLEWLTGEGMVVLPNGVPIWPHYDSFERYGLDGPWISALTQGQAISLLVRAASLTGEQRYAELAREATRAFTEPGLPIVWRGGEGEIFLEEFPCDPPSHALNGCLLAWLGLWDYARYSDDDQLRLFCESSMEGIKGIVLELELDGWTRYDAHQQRPTSPAYHELHAALAEALYEITRDPFWEERAIRWRDSASNPLRKLRVSLMVLSAKIRAKVAAVRGTGIEADVVGRSWDGSEASGNSRSRSGMEPGGDGKLATGADGQ